jgi:hypothetical protein
VPRTYFHVTSSLNRVSIQQYGLDWRRMRLAPGIAGSRQPEEDGIFLVNDEFSVVRVFRERDEALGTARLDAEG